MGQNISLFTEYHSQENTLTNYCGLILKLLYEENPKGFEEVIVNLTGDTVKSIVVNPEFSQQKRQGTSIPDLLIVQQSYAILFETKRFDWFYQGQIAKHVKSIANKKDVNVLFMISPDEIKGYDDRFNEIQKEAIESNVTIKAITFEQLVETIENIALSPNFKRYVDEFKIYLERNNYLPNWKYLLDVVSCRGTLNEVEKGFYMCPTSGGAYAHQRAKFFGPYANKQVSKIFEIAGLVIIKKNLGGFSVEWNNTDQPDSALIEKAQNRIEHWQKWRHDENKKVSLQMFILESPSITSFRKSSPGGMIQSKKYFWNIAKGFTSTEQLANKLKNKTWESFE